MDLNNEWEMFNENPEMELDYKSEHDSLSVSLYPGSHDKIGSEIHQVLCSPLYISTKTKIAYFKISEILKIQELFWNIPIISYHEPKEGILKKQIKITTMNENELKTIKTKLQDVQVKQVHVISDTIYNANKDKKHIQKISVGISKKDITCIRMKQKSVFYNCFALVVRVFDKTDKEYKEVHVKVFNTGKMEIPGIQNHDTLMCAIKMVFQTITNIMQKNIGYHPKTIDKLLHIETVLINANFNCGFYVKRESMYNLLRHDYNIVSLYDPCSYPGIQSKFYYNNNKSIQDGQCKCLEKCNKKSGECTEISFMIFRTGSALIVGHCSEAVIFCIYEFLKNVFKKNYSLLHDGVVDVDAKKKKTRKLKRNIVVVSSE